jgi:hypothetical protein
MQGNELTIKTPTRNDLEILFPAVATTQVTASRSRTFLCIYLGLPLLSSEPGTFIFDVVVSIFTCTVTQILLKAQPAFARVACYDQYVLHHIMATSTINDAK